MIKLPTHPFRGNFPNCLHFGNAALCIGILAVSLKATPRNYIGTALSLLYMVINFCNLSDRQKNADPAKVKLNRESQRERYFHSK